MRFAACHRPWGCYAGKKAVAKAVVGLYFHESGQPAANPGLVARLAEMNSVYGPVEGFRIIHVGASPELQIWHVDVRVTRRRGMSVDSVTPYKPSLSIFAGVDEEPRRSMNGADPWTAETVYDVVNQVVSMVTPLGNTGGMVYDPVGQRTASVDPLGNRATSVFDARRMLQARINPLGFIVTNSFDAVGNGTQTQNARGHFLRSHRVFDALNRRTATVDAINARTVFAIRLRCQPRNTILI